jgi:nuclear pore complex protein Nup153
LQSFVKKVASSVTNLLPQPAWLSKWFTSSVENEVSERDGVNLNNSGSADYDNDNVKVHTPPRKLSKIPLNQQFPPNSFKVSPVFNDQGMSKLLIELEFIYIV